jgi:hypothetical protein
MVNGQTGKESEMESKTGKITMAYIKKKARVRGVSVRSRC